MEVILTFGKYKGKSVEEVLKFDPAYIRWAIENVSDFNLPEKDANLALMLAEEDDQEDLYGVFSMYDV